jgi:hypothetical protein
VHCHAPSLTYPTRAYGTVYGHRKVELRMFNRHRVPRSRPKDPKAVRGGLATQAEILTSQVQRVAGISRAAKRGVQARRREVSAPDSFGAS